MSNDTSAASQFARLLERRTHQQVLIAAFGRFALRQTGQASLMQEAARRAAEGLHTAFAKVLEHEPKTDTLIVRAGVGWGPGVIDNVRFPPGATSPAGYAFAMGVPTFSNDLPNDHRFGLPKLLADNGIKREVNVVISGETGPPFGILEVDDTEDGAFSDDDVYFLEAIANTLGLALERDRLSSDRERLLDERGVLLAEVHHRVKNSLQLVHTVLTLQATDSADPATRALLELSAMRVLTIATVHERLYQGDSFDTIEMQAYLLGLVEALSAGLRDLEPGRSVSLDADPGTRWPPRRAQALGLILTELVTNALKYGKGDVRIRFAGAAPPDGVRLEVEDDGLPPERDVVRSGDGVGLRIVRALLEELGGSLSFVTRSTGTHVVADHHLANRGGQHEPHLAGPHLLVALQRAQHRLWIEGRQLERQPRLGHHSPLALLIGRAPQPHGHRQLPSGQHSQRHRLTVEVGAIAAEGFHHMAQGVAVVEDRPQAPFPFVGGHHASLSGGGALQQPLQQGRREGIKAGEVSGRLQVGEQRGVTDHAVLDHLRHAGTELPRRQGGQGVWVDQHQAGLVEGADQVLAAGMVHAGLATDRRIHHGQQGGGHLHHGDAPQPSGGGEARHVAHP
jgi:two-component sensor histidine kinase